MKTMRWLLALAGLLTGSIGAGSEPPVTPLGQASVYQLQSRWTTDSGRDMRLAELTGHYHIVAFIFTHCGGACPLLVKSLQIQSRSLPQRVQERTRFLLVSMDPARDTVQALRSYRKNLALDERWTLLRGADDDVRELAAVLGFNYERTADGQFAHSNQVTLLSSGGEIVLQHPDAEGAISAMSSAIAECDSRAATRPHIPGSDCH